jgi:excisionase family DNA binding protein
MCLSKLLRRERELLGIITPYESLKPSMVSLAQFLLRLNAGKSVIAVLNIERGKQMEEIMTPLEVAALLKIHLKTVYKLAERGAIPGSRIGRSWRFSRHEVLELVSSRSMGISDNGESSLKSAMPTGK